jgi:equilibrative nucleoside transporter 1/2/3
MFIAAGPYFRQRFSSDDRLLNTFQSAEQSVSTVANLASMVILTNLQARASYPKRIIWALITNVGVFLLMALSTKLFPSVSAATYYGFLMAMVLVSSAATGLMQNGIFAYMSSFGREEYAQSTMTGQALAGVLPSVVQIISVLSAPAVQSAAEEAKESSRSALSFFLTATGISVATLLAFFFLLAHNRRSPNLAASVELTMSQIERKRVPLTRLLRKTFWLSTSVLITFAIAMFFPVYTQKITSVVPPDEQSRILQPAAFVPLGLLVWNSGDLIGRLSTAVPFFRITHRPKLIFTIAVARVVFIPLYFLCNIDGKGAVINSDFFYLFFNQLLFGITNGFIGTLCMMGATEYVDVEEREATGAFMSLMLVTGLAVGSLLSFAAS